MDSVFEVVQTLIAVLVAITFHEFAHGYVSYKLGDPTPKQTGRLSLNPFRHLDFLGTICLMVVHFGWAKPVQVNPNYYKNPKKGMVLVALGGPVMNFFIALFSVFFMGVILKVTGGQVTVGYMGDIIIFVYGLLQMLAIINLSLGIFNLIPIPPLDGSKILGAILPQDKYFKYMRYERFGYLALLLILSFDVLRTPLNMIMSGMYEGVWFIVSFILGV
ncbi:site-2 protease family protein [Niameybacter massiliensis]|uniref:Site-2 protease family protein n=1 Tax=Holtiella tumoricola TaxID=3018743 RepID=A0AA42DQX9_9FIRM|nr:site-2 protease family protein [Holtiella tumoricola]MDA3733466.1 site-2 protease family protein [Holtiella tumoricola]